MTNHETREAYMHGISLFDVKDRLRRGDTDARADRFPSLAQFDLPNEDQEVRNDGDGMMPKSRRVARYLFVSGNVTGMISYENRQTGIIGMFHELPCLFKVLGVRFGAGPDECAYGYETEVANLDSNFASPQALAGRIRCTQELPEQFKVVPPSRKGPMIRVSGTTFV